MRNSALILSIALLAGCGAEKVAEKKAEEKPPEPPPAVYQVKFETTKGDFVVEARKEWAPHGSDHFYELVQAKFYDGVKFHRVVRNFVCQFGINGTPRVQRYWSSTMIPDDPVKESNGKGTVTYAKIGPNTRSTQVFINLKDNKDLDASGFAPFGKVVSGMDVVEKLYFAYGEVMPRGSGLDPTQLELQGNVYAERNYPRLDAIKTATVIK